MKEKEKTTMKQIILSPIETPTEEELQVAKILLDLPNIVSVSESRRSKFEWVGRRRRSSLNAGASSSRAPSSLSQSVQNVQETVHRVVKVTASPDTPLSFSPSESDENTKHSSKKNIKKRSSEEYLDMIDQLTQRRDCLRGEIENVMKYYNKLKSQNSELKAMKQEVLKICQSKEESQLETSREANYRVEQAHHYQVALVHHQPYIADQAFQFPIGPNTAQLYNNGFRMVNDMGPLGIPDLNLSAEEAFVVDAGQPLDVNRAFDDRRARFAENRRLRRGKIKIKNMRNECGIKLPRLN